MELELILKSAENGDSNAQFIIASCYNQGVYVSKDEEKAFEWYLKSAEGGNHKAQFTVGYFYDEGISVPKDARKAFEWYLKSAKAENFDGQFSVGFCYENGIGISKDNEKAFEWYLKSAEGGNSMGKFNVGKFYSKGIGISKDEKKAFEWYLKSAESGNSYGQFNIGLNYQNGVGVSKDEKKAFEWYLKAAENGNHNGQYNVGICYDEGIGISKNEKKAFVWYLKSAEGGNTEGQFRVGYCYQNSVGISEDVNKAFEFYLKSAEGGNSMAQFNVGLRYQNGIGVCVDEKKAFEWYLNSAEGGYSVGQLHLGICYQKSIGTSKDDTKAFEWYLKSAKGGDSDGQLNVGFCYEDGVGISKDEKKAFEWYLKSAENGNSIAQLRVGLCYRNGIGIPQNQEKAVEWLQMSRNNINKQDSYESGNAIIDDFIKDALSKDNYTLSWIPFNQLNIIKNIGEGGFATVYLARWKDSNELDRPVALKLLHKSQNNCEELLKELKTYYNIGCKSPSFLQCHGISRDEDATNNYILVMQYADKGSLRQNIHITMQMKWKEKLNLLSCIANDLQIMHSHNIIHCDLHSGNILQNDFYSAYIGDLGLSITLNNALKTKPDEIYGILPYIAPEVLFNKSYSPASDVYSFAMITYEISSGYPPFPEIPHDIDLARKILYGLRPRIPSHVPKPIAKLIMKCWDARPSKRLTSKEAYDTIKMLYNEILKDDPTENIDQINKCGNETDNSLASDLSTKFYYKLHPGAIYTSQLLDFFDLPSPMNASDYDEQFEELECYTLNDVQYLPKESDGLLLEVIVNE